MAAKTQEQAGDVTIKVRDATLDVSVAGATAEAEQGTVAGLTDSDLQTLQRVVSEEAARRGATEPRPFRDMDTESLLVLYHSIRDEVASR